MSAIPRQTVPRQLASVKHEAEQPPPERGASIRAAPQGLAVQEVGERRGRDLDPAQVDAVGRCGTRSGSCPGLRDVELLVADEHDPAAQLVRRDGVGAIGYQQVGGRVGRDGAGRA